MSQLMTTAVRERVRRPGLRMDAIRGRLTDLARGHTGEAAWERLAPAGVGLLAAVLYLWNLTVSGYANVYYSGAALAASQSWSAWFFGSLDASNFITIDKPPLAVMLMGLSVRLFGLSSWSVLLPEALLGVASVLLLFVLVRRTFGPAAAVIASVVMALTPAAVLMFRYNNPDALLTFLLIGGAWALQRALERGSVRWLAVSAIFVGLGFNAKFLQAYLVLPAFVLTWLAVAPVPFRRRLAGLIPMAVAGIVSSFWWVAIVSVIPADQRPFIGGSTDGSPLQLLFGYDGLGRIFGQGPGGSAAPGVGDAAGFGGPAGGAGGPGFSGTTGLLRLFNAQLGDQVSWLIPLAAVALVAGLVIHARAPRTDLRRGAYLLWGGWLLVTGLVFSLMSGIIHSYYAVVLAPAIGALAGAGVVELWQRRAHSPAAGFVLAAGVMASAVLSAALLNRTPDFLPGIDIVLVTVAFAASVLIAAPQTRPFPRLSVAAGVIALAVLLAGPAAYAASTVNTAYSGGDPSASLTAGGRQGGPGGAGFPGGSGFPGADDTPGATGAAGSNAALYDYLVTNRGTTSWIVAVQNAEQAASIELATGSPVMAMGGFSGTDPAPTLDQLKAYVASGRLRFVIVGGGGPGGGFAGGGPGGAFGGSGTLTSWITANGTRVTSVSGVNLYDLSGAVTSAT